MAELLPELCEEICRLLRDEGEYGLAAFLPSMPVVGPCECDGDHCQSFYTASRPAGRYGLGHRNIALSPESGMVILDVVHGAIMFVEVLGRPGVKVAIPAC
ncbi:hypothetical protein GCM10023205_06070 [Yinghuangia aomiensis]|uniref:Uncharacterized protein n=1 Tax=Yinghuangia aomiensis TaxID=676205 RepID=A0ABP9GNI9_9ACTN